MDDGAVRSYEKMQFYEHYCNGTFWMSIWWSVCISINMDRETELRCVRYVKLNWETCFDGQSGIVCMSVFISCVSVSTEQLSRYSMFLNNIYSDLNGFVKNLFETILFHRATFCFTNIYCSSYVKCKKWHYTRCAAK